MALPSIDHNLKESSPPATWDRLRPYQKQTYIDCRKAYAQGHRQVMVMLPCGGGKTALATALIDRLVRTGKPCLFVVPFLALISQTIQALQEQGLEVGCWQGQHPQWRPKAPVQVCSAQTLSRRDVRAHYSKVSGLIIDEAHLQYGIHDDLISFYPDAPCFGLSATPTAKGLGKRFTHLVKGATTAELVEQGYLVRSQVFAPSTLDTAGIGDQLGDYNQRQLGEAAAKQVTIVGDIVGNWIAHGEGRPTLCFPVNKRHSMAIVAEFLNCGVPAVHIQDTTSSEDRTAAFSQLRTGELKVISSVGCLTAGLDLPLVSCLIFARPTKSSELHFQIWGRGLRPAEGKANCRIFDHAGNTIRLGMAEDNAPTALDDGKRKTSSGSERVKQEAKPTLCGNCKAVKPKGIHACPECGYAPAPAETGVHATDEELVEIGGRSVSKPEDKQSWWSQLLWLADERGYKRGWASYKYREKFGVWPKGLADEELPPTPQVRRFVRSQAVAFAKQRATA